MAAVKTRRKVAFGKKMAAVRLAAQGKPRTAEAAAAIMVAATTVTRLEAGSSCPDWPTILGLGRYYGLTDEQIKSELFPLWQSARQSNNTIVEHAANLPPKYLSFRQEEADATDEWIFCVAALGGQLQLGSYAVAQGRWRAQSSEEGWKQRVIEERRDRQKLLYRDPPLGLHAIISEHLLWQMIGGREVMVGQLEHLLELAELPHVRIQVVPIGADAWATNPVTLLTFDDDDPDLAYLEHAGGGVTVENEVDVQALKDTFQAVGRNTALPEDRSLELIGAVLNARRKNEQPQPFRPR
ncbi:DUF5753 domain-containing protein [Amycolatopsis sp. lyj-112]|uniref:DUF5753 domain-containing protein n=1 Tax=Amycolatopsis sp. lyj-112 TaxID=2789288 RepID=UPI00397BF044